MRSTLWVASGAPRCLPFPTACAVCQQLQASTLALSYTTAEDHHHHHHHHRRKLHTHTHTLAHTCAHNPAGAAPRATTSATRRSTRCCLRWTASTRSCRCGLLAPALPCPLLLPGLWLALLSRLLTAAGARVVVAASMCVCLCVCVCKGLLAGVGGVLGRHPPGPTFHPPAYTPARLAPGHRHGRHQPPRHPGPRPHPPRPL